jgi:acyl dehydratase
MAQIIGKPVIARNESSESIHDPARAKALGFRGSAVAGIFHLDCFAPLLLEAYGEDWWRRGGISLYFQNIVISGEPVQAVVETPAAAGAMTRVFARRADEPSIIVAEGTAALNEHARHELQIRDLRLGDASRLRLLKGVTPGAVIGEKTVAITAKRQDAMLASGGINQDMPFYHGTSPWGGAVASISQAAHLMVQLGHAAGHSGLLHLAPDSDRAAGMYGACELVFVNGPIFLDKTYRVRGTVVGAGGSPKTEYVWWDATAHDEKGTLVARVRHLLRFIKAGSPLYPELSAA